ncbi:TIR domain-containing protein [Afipia carboxidovorans]|uniref:TIR domain-containing protein n=1 Tax=Afipia carboxidovorans TaxID=40137 RepID=UPI00308B91FF|nr:hypothetical protein CRBSH125_12480 [Afipia carboxidovorans]
MAAPMLEDVFKRSGLPTITFVEPAEYDHLKVALRTPGRGVVVEGPSGIGKTTAVRKAATEMGLGDRAQMLSGRNPDDISLISEIPGIKDAGIVIIDDFHRLDDKIKHSIAEYLKVLADKEDTGSKIVLIGINKAGDSLVNFAADLNNRIDTIHFEVNDLNKVKELIAKGEDALNIKIECTDALAADASGSFHVAQILCHELCLHSGITERADAPTRIETSVEAVKERVLSELSRAFREKCVEFARGRRFRREGRAPYLHLLLALIRSDGWTCSIDQLLSSNPQIRGSLGQVVDKGHLRDFLNERDQLRDLFHYDPYTRVLAVEDPKVMYFLRNLLWSKFVKEVGFISVEFRAKYDFAISFAGEVREVALQISTRLKEHELEVFYDHDEQHKILAQDVEQYLGPIYRSEARFVVALLSKEFPKKIWTKFESENFKQRFGEGSVIPIWFADAPPGMFDESIKVGGLVIDPSKDVVTQIEKIVDVLVLKAGEERQAEEVASNARDHTKEVEES